MSVNKEIGIDAVYVVHGIQGYEEREKMLLSLLKNQYTIDFQFVTESADTVINDRWIKQYFKEDIRQILSSGALFCTLVHILCYENIIKNDQKNAIIFENDVCFLGDFVTKIKPIIKESQQLDEGFIISLENSTLRFPSWRKIKKGKLLYEAASGRCAGAYLLDKKAAQKMLDDLKINKCQLVIDWWHNDLIERKIVKMYWAHPPITEQGSFNGKLPSTISARPRGNIRTIRWEIQKFYKTYLLRWFK
jgi:glycosyl transferase, family 25